MTLFKGVVNLNGKVHGGLMLSDSRLFATCWDVRLSQNLLIRLGDFYFGAVWGTRLLRFLERYADAAAPRLQCNCKEML